MEIRQILTFKKVVEAGSITSAAKELNYSQPTATLHIHELEAELGVQLFNRIGKKLILTDAGHSLYECSRDLSLILKKASSIGAESRRKCGTLRLAVAPAIADYKLFDMLTEFIIQHPFADIQIINDHNSKKIYDQLYNGSVDFAILTGKWYNTNDITIKSLEKCRHILVIGSCIASLSINLTEPNKPLGCRLILNHYLSTSRQEIEGYLNNLNIRPDGLIEAWNIDMIKKFVQQNLGLAFLPRFVVEQELKDGSIAQVDTDIDFAQYEINLAYLKNKWMSPLIEDFLNSLLKHFSKE